MCQKFTYCVIMRGWQNVVLEIDKELKWMIVLLADNCTEYYSELSVGNIEGYSYRQTLSQ